MNQLIGSIISIIHDARQSVARSVNSAMVQAYWEIGRLIVEEEQQGEKRAAYGDFLLEELSGQLSKEFGRGFSQQNLRSMRQFYLTFNIRSALPSESVGTRQEIRSALRSELSWTHYKLLMRVENENARAWYLNEAADQQWSTRQLERQITTLYYERLLSSHDKEPVRTEAAALEAPQPTESFIRDPYILEFLNLSDRPHFRESDLEQALIDNLQHFLLELGRGFSFVKRQKHIRMEGEDFFIDLVFYNYHLKCFVLIDLKLGKLTHQDIGQMDMYIRLFEEQQRLPEDNPTIGLILCSEKNEAIVKYSMLKDSKQVFASKYKLYLPSEEELRQELLREREQLEENLEDRS